MTNEELKRYDRHIILPEIGIEGQQKLMQASVLVIGAGGLGCPLLQYLVAAGVGTIGIVDDDTIDESNLQRQILYNIHDIGKAKVSVAIEKLSAQNPFCKFNSHQQRLAADNALEIIANYDIVVDGSDNFPTRYLVNDACVMLDKTLVFGSVFKFEGQVAVFNYNGSATYRCLYPDPPASEDVPNCSDIGVLGVLPGLTGLMQATEVIKIITGIGEVLSNKLLRFDALSMNFETFSFYLNPANKNIKSFSNYEEFCNTMIQEISAEELKEKIRLKENIQIIDVREPSEYAKKNIGATLIPLGELSKNLDKIEKTIPVIIHCQSGMRSRKAVELLREEGFNNVYSLRGGLANL
jgi:molybdopterin/thiamine biosynthesis adenylyltransferase/rhodanese-related sulfurtransferase